MRLPASEVERFYKLHPALLLYANQQLGLARHVTTIPQLLAMPEEERYALRDLPSMSRGLCLIPSSRTIHRGSPPRT